MNTDWPMPANIARLDRNKVGYPIPWFVDRTGQDPAEPDFRIVDGRKIGAAVRGKLCWICGQKRGVFGSFLVGPMCAINQVSAEPPAHNDCAVYSARVCPFLTVPNMVRRTTGLPADKKDPPGVMVLRNPGVALVYTSRTFQPTRVGGGLLFDLGLPVDFQWFAEGRTATVEEILHSLATGLPILMEAAERDGPRAIADAQHRYDVLVDQVQATG